MDATSWIPLLIYLGFLLVIVPRIPKKTKQKKLGQNIAKDIVTMLNDPEVEKEIMCGMWNKFVTERFSSNPLLLRKLLIDETRYNIDEKQDVFDVYVNDNPIGESEQEHTDWEFKILKMISDLYKDDVIIYKFINRN